jgi:hypothetical protein
MEQNMYILLPVNPGEIQFQMPISVTNESYRSTKITYIWRDRGFKSMFSSPTVNFNIPSGNIFPSFSQSHIEQAQAVARGLSTDKDAQGLQSFYNNQIPYGTQIKDPRIGAYTGVSNNGKNTTDAGVNNAPQMYRGDIPIGIQNVYAFHALAEERHIRKVSSPDTNTDNRVVAVLNSLIFPRLVLYGYFGEDGIQTEETSENPGEVNLSFSLVVTDTYPRLKYGNWSELNDMYINQQGSDETTLDFAKTQARKI